ncbi:MAG: WG repeat-containing protein [Bacteroides sp.]|nr:WG repeat-containing protein [Bacteroides sp.]MCM1477703.1 WG repeat-containing protein [Bacteroides sp.]
MAALSGCSPEGTATTVVERDFSELGPMVSAYLPAREGDTVPNWGMVRSDGSMLFSDKFPSAPSLPINGYFSVKEGAGVTVYRNGPAPMSVVGLAGLKQAGAMSESLIPVVRPGHRIELVDGEGVTKMELTSIGGIEIVACAPYFVDGLLAVKSQDGLWGAMNLSGEMILEPVYDEAPMFSEGLASVVRTETVAGDSINPERRVIRRQLVNNHGKTVFRFPDGIKPESLFKGGRMVIAGQSGELSMLSANGTVRSLPKKVKEVVDFNSDYIVWRGTNGYGVFDMEGNELVAPELKQIELADSGRLLVAGFDGRFAIADSAGRARVRFTGFDDLRSLRHPAYGVVSPFKLMGDGFAGKVIMDSRGHRLGVGPLADLSLAATLAGSEEISSDYFNAQAAAHSLLSRITPRGWGRAELGMRLAMVADSLTWRHAGAKNVEFERSTPYLLKLSATAYSDRPLGVDSLSNESTRQLVADTAAVVKYIKVTALTQGKHFPELLQHAGAELVPHGYRAEKIRDEYAVYLSQDMAVILTPVPGLAGICVFIMPRSFYGETGSRIISDAENIYKQSLHET